MGALAARISQLFVGPWIQPERNTTSNEPAEGIGVAQGAISQHLARLENEKYPSGQRSPQDGRVHVFRLEKRGRPSGGLCAATTGNFRQSSKTRFSFSRADSMIGGDCCIAGRRMSFTTIKESVMQAGISAPRIRGRDVAQGGGKPRSRSATSLPGISSKRKQVTATK
ncbi:MarR family winged helix-turn-helix transcriptional regulator [Sciscionella sediminilitoris]|uniref:MarR family winged helix-turn-helix transcriptional regulator n=1 Tax=Sciscionella sediminilitoris TaxID=1445613 RepID=UPI0004DEE249|nr:MarR family winged helix-turn-helix transcriptional regulator [Sciscionella sp. SE31]